MKTKVKIAKRLLSILLVFLFSINSFAAVSDNDGSAFITKSEFDALKSSFQSQIDTYNQNIDSKIDGAIAAYLSGLSISKEVNLYLDSANAYTFPLRYDNNENWNNPDHGWYNLSVPQVVTKAYDITIGMGDKYSQQSQQPWIWQYPESDNGVLKIASKSEIEEQYQWELVLAEEMPIKIPSKDGLMIMVERTTQSRSINLGSGAQNYKIYKTTNKGHGSQKIVTGSVVNFAGMKGGSGNIAKNIAAGNSQYTYYHFYLCSVNVRNNTIASSNDYWSPIHLVSTQGGYLGSKADGPIPFLQGEFLSVSEIRDRWIPNAPFTQSVWILNANSNIVSKAVDYVDNNVNYIFGRGANMPANISGNYLFKGKVSTSNTKKQLTSLSDSVPKVLSEWGWTFSSTGLYTFVVRCNNLWLPPVYASDNAKYDCNDTDYFSKLPSTLVTYDDSNGNKHYFDEGMFLGNMKMKGEVSFKVNFQRNAGSGTKVKLHISKKPFSYNFNNSDLLEYKINNTSGKEQQLSYGTEYNVIIPDIEIGDQLYMEWVPVTSGDVSALTSFNDYKCTSKDK